MTKKINSLTLPPTLAADAMQGAITDFANCRSLQDDGALNYRAAFIHTNEHPLWFYRIEGLDLCDELPTLTLRIGRQPITDEHASLDPECEDGYFSGYAPAATYENARIFWAGTPQAIEKFMDAFEIRAAQSEKMALAMSQDASDDGALEIVLCRYPRGDIATLTFCDTNHNMQRRAAILALIDEVESHFPGTVSAMHCRAENDYCWMIHDVCNDQANATGGEITQAVMLTIYDQDPTLQDEFKTRSEEDPGDHEYLRLEQALARRELDHATPKTKKRTTSAKTSL